MKGGLMTIMVLAILIIPSVPIAYSADISVSNTGNSVQFFTPVEHIADDIVVENNTSGTGESYDAVVDEQNKNQIHIQNQNGEPTVNASGPVDISLTLPKNTEFMICVNVDIKLFSNFTFTMTYTPEGYDAPVTCVGEMKAGLFSTQYYYPVPPANNSPDMGTIEKVKRGDSYENHYFTSLSEITFTFNGNAEFNNLGIDLSIIVRPQ